MATLTAGATALALKIQEQGDQLSNSDVCRWLSDALSDMDCCYVDHIGDGDSGDVIYSDDGDLKRAAYQITAVNGKGTAKIDDDGAEDVLPRTTYEPEADDEDHYASMEAAKLYAPGAARIIERFISKGERDAADSGSFAGKGKSFPILRPGDVMAAVKSLGRAGSANYDTDTLKKNIKRIAKKKGFPLPKAWQKDSDSQESADSTPAGELKLVESASFQDQIRVSESNRTDYMIKLIAPGRGSSAYYPREVLERDGPKVFKAGTHMYWNHATDAEEAGRPEGDLNSLAGVLTTDARYDANGKYGEGLYARAKVFSDYAQKVEEKAPHIGVSIRASGNAEKDKRIEGRPVLREILSAESTDFVTRPGAGGMVLTESFTGASIGETQAVKVKFQESEDMTEDDRRILRETQSELKKLREREALRDVVSANGPIASYFSTVNVHPAVMRKVTERLMERWESGIPMKDGRRDDEAIAKMVEAETRDEVAFLESVNPTGRIHGLGAPAAADPKKAAKEFKESYEDTMKEMSRFMCGTGKEKKKFREAFREGRYA